MGHSCIVFLILLMFVFITVLLALSISTDCMYVCFAYYWISINQSVNAHVPATGAAIRWGQGHVYKHTKAKASTSLSGWIAVPASASNHSRGLESALCTRAHSGDMTSLWRQQICIEAGDRWLRWSMAFCAAVFCALLLACSVCCLVRKPTTNDLRG